MLEFLNEKTAKFYDVVVMDKLKKEYPEKFSESGQMDYEWFEKEIRPKKFIYARRDVNSLSFTIQKGPIKEVGVNGCQIDDVIKVVKGLIVEANTKYPCTENGECIHHLNLALEALESRTKNRTQRGVEGTNQQ